MDSKHRNTSEKVGKKHTGSVSTVVTLTARNFYFGAKDFQTKQTLAYICAKSEIQNKLNFELSEMPLFLYWCGKLLLFESLITSRDLFLNSKKKCSVGREKHECFSVGVLQGYSQITRNMRFRPKMRHPSEVVAMPVMGSEWPSRIS